MGYFWQGACYQTVDDAVEAFTRSSATIDSRGVNSLCMPVPQATSGGLISFCIKSQSFAGGVSTNSSGILQLQPCTADLSQWSGSSIMFVAALFFAAMLGFRSGFRP